MTVSPGVYERARTISAAEDAEVHVRTDRNSANRHFTSAQAVWRQPSHLVPLSKYVFAIHAVHAEIRRTLHQTTIVKLIPISLQSIAHVMLLCPIRTIFELAGSQGSDGPVRINSPRVLASLPLKIVGGKLHVRKVGGTEFLVVFASLSTTATSSPIRLPGKR
jgi:hypothetical protein